MSERVTRKAKKAATRKKILAAGRELFDRDGYEAVTMRGLAAAIEMSTGSLFSNFPDKATLYRTVYGHPPITPELGRRMVERLQEMRGVLQASGLGDSVMDAEISALLKDVDGPLAVGSRVAE